MPSKPVLKAVSANDFPDTDPMAELSRIMGLTRDAANQDPDFELDLEQELMGEFGSVEASEQAASASTGDREDIDLSSLSADFDEAFSGMLAETEAPSGASVEDETGSAKEADDAQDANLAGVDEVFEGLDLTLDDEFLAEAPQVASDASIAVDTLPSDDLHPGEAATVSAPVSDCEVAQIAADSSDPATDVEHSAASSAGEAVAAPVVSAPSSLEDELRALLGRVNAPGMRAPEPANDGGRSEMRVAASVPAGSGAAISDRAPVGVPEIHVEADDDVSGLYVGDGDVSPEEEGTAPLDGLPSFEDFSFDENDFESAELASALEETLAGDEQLHAAAEA